MNSRMRTPATSTTRPTAIRMAVNDTGGCYWHSPSDPDQAQLRGPVPPGASDPDARGAPAPSTTIVGSASRPSRRRSLLSPRAPRTRHLEYRVVAVKVRAKRRRRRWLIAVGVVVVIGAWAALAAAKSVSAYHHDQQGLASLEQVKSNLTPDEATISTSIDQLDAAQAEFNEAKSDLSSPLFAPVTILPVLGRQFRAVQALSAAAGTVSGVGSTFLTQVHEQLNQPHTAGPERVASLRKLAAVSASAESQLVGVEHRAVRCAHLPVGLQAQRVRHPAQQRSEPVGQGGGGFGGDGDHSAGPRELRGAGGQQCGDAGRLGDVSRRGHGHHRQRDRPPRTAGSLRCHAASGGGGPGDRRPAAELGLAVPEPGHAQSRSDPSVRRDRPAGRPDVEQAHRPARRRGDRARHRRGAAAPGRHRAGAGRWPDHQRRQRRAVPAP